MSKGLGGERREVEFGCGLVLLAIAAMSALLACGLALMRIGNILEKLVAR